MGAVRKPPPITLPTYDFDRLVTLGLAAYQRGDPEADFLLSELERAASFDARPPLGDVVVVTCRVTYRLDDEPTVHARRLVYPSNVIASEDEISATSPLGVAMLGLGRGDRMPFRDTATGREHVVEIADVGPPRCTNDAVPPRPFDRLLG
ncbi:MAG TPA: GreA/GreB family elongation factor [Methylobacterium sp.]|jgi:transcription elongation GreA/GreB family factor|uniref:GreA/GreB family elongation factor n=1 Tax=Methylorubrum sp. B1-46 TaxID=2897334 RepID=UPI001E49312D|nr:GreA/GreB family elongation factor [Methylorubrum sp. B1-46]UGB26024.1 GreA/GreB family elongation factor [Methylorubrum sp. B1-46]HEV2544400.1 GreA/GreB family elongation factor [Methylobacterium sp.]